MAGADNRVAEGVVLKIPQPEQKEVRDYLQMRSLGITTDKDGNPLPYPKFLGDPTYNLSDPTRQFIDGAQSFEGRLPDSALFRRQAGAAGDVMYRQNLRNPGDIGINNPLEFMRNYTGNYAGDVSRGFNAYNTSADPYQRDVYGERVGGPNVNFFQQAGPRQISRGDLDPYLSRAPSLDKGGIREVGEGDYGIGELPMWTDPSARFSYMSPYMEAVTSDRLARLGDDFQRQGQSVRSDAAKAGAFGGGRHGIVEANLQDEYMQQRNEIQNQDRVKAYENAQQQMERDRAAYTQAKGIGAGNNLQAALANQQAFLKGDELNLASQLRGMDLGGEQSRFNVGQQTDVGRTNLGANVEIQKLREQLTAQVGAENADRILKAGISNQDQAYNFGKLFQDNQQFFSGQNLQADLANQSTMNAARMRQLQGITSYGNLGLESAMGQENLMRQQQQANTQGQSAYTDNVMKQYGIDQNAFYDWQKGMGMAKDAGQIMDKRDQDRLEWERTQYGNEVNFPFKQEEWNANQYNRYFPESEGYTYSSDIQQNPSRWGQYFGTGALVAGGLGEIWNKDN